MAFKALTEEGKNFIRFICKGTSTTLISGKNTFPLPYSNQPSSTIYTAQAKNDNGDNITNNKELGEALISWFNKYSEMYIIDANIIAAQTYAESKYKLWAYSDSLSGKDRLNSSNQGLSQLTSSNIYDIAIGQTSVVNSTLPLFDDSEVDKLTLNLTNSNQKNSYNYKSNNTSIDIAKGNRTQLFQNIMDNPELIIKAQCRYMAALSTKGANIAASALFGYKLGYSYVDSTYTKTVTRSKRENDLYGDGLKYVKNIFELLGKKETNPSSVWFGYDDIDFSFDTFTADLKSTDNQLDDIDGSTTFAPSKYTVSDLTTTSTGIINIPTKEEFNRLNQLANKVLEPINSQILKTKRLLINSSFRSDLVNSAVGGVDASQHREGEAADVRVVGIDMFQLFKDIISSGIVFDQIIFEEGNTIWIHISYNSDGVNRMDAKTATFPNGKAVYKQYS